MRVLFSTLVLSTVVVASGCGSEPPRSALYEDELNRELVLALDAYREREMHELNDAAQNKPEPEPVAPAATAPRQTAARSAPRPQASPQRQPQPRVITETNVKRDAAIGAGVGAVAGAVIHKPNRVKGAVVGAVLGGAAGAVVGATIDKKTKVVYH